MLKRNHIYCKTSREIGVTKKILRYIFISCTAFMTFGCHEERQENATYPTVLTLLSQPLWVPRDAYDASHFLMVPMHAVFSKSDQKAMQAYKDFFLRFQENGLPDLVTDRLARLHFLYFFSRFNFLLSTDEHCSSRVLSSYNTTLSLWLHIVMSPAWQWDRASFSTIFERIRWKLTQNEVDFSYYRAIIDEELFALAIGADLITVGTRCGQEQIAQFDEVRNLVLSIYTNELTRTSIGGWVLQKGVWTDHPDYAYAGHAELGEKLFPSPVPGISPDSSHSFRQPLFLISFSCAEPAGSSTRDYYTILSTMLAKQWITRVVLMPDISFNGVRLNNFMDGENGVYRYGYITQGVGNGFGPYQLSGTVNIGWWSFLGSVATPVYRAQVMSLPFDTDVITTYTGPNTSRIRNPAFTEPNFYADTLIQETLNSAQYVSSKATWCSD